MIHSIFSNLPTFKTLDLHPGLNILLADKTRDSSSQQTRNGSGKSSLIELIHFLMGSECGKDCIFINEHLKNYKFGSKINLETHDVTVVRSGESKSEITLNTDTPQKFGQNTINSNNSYLISNTEWKKILGSNMFHLSTNQCSDEEIHHYASFRSMLSYFLRRERVGGMSKPINQVKQQKTWDCQTNISYLLGLNWKISSRWENIREKEKSITELKKAAGNGALSDIIGNVSKLRTHLIIREEKIDRMKRDLVNFKVLPEYRELEKEASELTRQISDLSNENTLDYQIIQEIESILKEEEPPTDDKIVKIYNEAGLIFPDDIIDRLEDLKKFHKSIIKNRKKYLENEISDAKKRIENRDINKEMFSSRRVEIMNILKSHNALDQFTKLNEELSKIVGETHVMRQRFEAGQQLENTKTKLKIDRESLLIELRQDFDGREDLLRHIILVFEEISQQLYEEAGSLEITESENGPQFEITIHGEAIKGINNMQIFCFDMMLIQIQCEMGNGPGFLIHDSHLFDPVDERQIATAMEIGAKKAKEYGFQYIITMNSDRLPSSFSDGFDIHQYILPVRLTDATDDGGLFGIKF